MSSLKNSITTPEDAATGETQDTFRRKLLRNRSCLWPRRYIMALLLFILLLIRTWRKLNVTFTIAHIFVLGKEAHEMYPTIGNWTIEELGNFDTVILVAELFAEIPGALLIYIFSSHKYILFSITGTSLLHMLTPAALQHHTASLLVLLFGQVIIEAPLEVAVISVWKDWAPPLERTKLILFSLFGSLMGHAATSFYPYLFHYIVTNQSYYFAGIFGLIWGLFWYNIVSETPQTDPLISEQELWYLEANIPSDVQQNTKLKYVPWKSIMTSKQVLILCLVFFKMAFSMQTISTCAAIFGIHLSELYNPLYLFAVFLMSFMIITPSSAVLADYLIQRFGGRTLLIRKCFLCGGFLLQCVFMFGTTSASEITKAVFYMISYLCFAASLSGFITLAMDLTPRYVVIIAGFVYTFYSSGTILVQYLVENTIDLLKLDTLSWIFLCDGLISLTCAALFAIWGDVEEQLWSLSFSRSPRASRSDGYRSYPKPDDQDDVDLVPKNAETTIDVYNV